jgi:hypothetical protein
LELPFAAFPCKDSASTFAYINLESDRITDFEDLALESLIEACLDFDGPYTCFIDKAFSFATSCLKTN